MAFEDDFKQAGGSNEIYSDFTAAFIPHPNTKQITRRTNEESVKNSIRNIILTNKYERLRNPKFGGNIRNYLFEPFSPLVENSIKEDIETLLKSHEPRIKTLEVRVNAFPDDSALGITIVFNTVTTQTAEQVDITLYRVR